jgi:HlyD family secretion protein
MVTHAAFIIPDSAPAPRQIRATGTVQAAHALTIRVPQIAGQGGRLTLTRLVTNGAQVKQGEVLAEFDRNQQSDNARDAQARLDDLGHQVEQKQAEFRSNFEKRTADLRKAEADLSKARLQLRRGSLLSEIDRLKNEARAEDAQAHVESLNRSNVFREQAEAASLRYLQLLRDRQKVGLDRSLNNIERLVVRAPLSGMVSLENLYRAGSLGHAQEGDQLSSGQALIRVFDPSQMIVETQVGEPDGAVLVAGTRAKVRVDAYPELAVDAHFLSASPVATSALGGPVKSFTALFRLEQSDPHLLPDLSAAVIIEGHAARR